MTINSEEELGNALYDVYDFNFVYPFTVTLDNGEIVTVEDEEDIEDLLEDCYDDYDDDYECEECENEPIIPVCIEYTTASGETVIEVFPNLCFAECLGYSAEDVVDCEDQSADCNENDITNNLTECEWYGFSSVLDQSDILSTTFGADGSITIEIENAVYTGTWEVSSSPNGGLFMFFDLPEPLDSISNLDWMVVECSSEYILLQSNNDFFALEKDCD